MPQKDDGGSQVNHGKKIFWVAFPANHDAAIVMQPGKQAFNFPSPTITVKHPAVLGQSSGAVGSVWCNHLDAVVLHQSLIEAVAVVGAIADQPLGEIGEESFFKGGFDEFG